MERDGEAHAARPESQRTASRNHPDARYRFSQLAVRQVQTVGIVMPPSSASSLVWLQIASRGARTRRAGWSAQAARGAAVPCAVQTRWPCSWAPSAPSGRPSTRRPRARFFASLWRAAGEALVRRSRGARPRTGLQPVRVVGVVCGRLGRMLRRPSQAACGREQACSTSHGCARLQSR